MMAGPWLNRPPSLRRGAVRRAVRAVGSRDRRVLHRRALPARQPGDVPAARLHRAGAHPENASRRDPHRGPGGRRGGARAGDLRKGEAAPGRAPLRAQGRLHRLGADERRGGARRVGAPAVHRARGERHFGAEALAAPEQAPLPPHGRDELRLVLDAGRAFPLRRGRRARRAGRRHRRRDRKRRAGRSRASARCRTRSGRTIAPSSSATNRSPTSCSCATTRRASCVTSR